MTPGCDTIAFGGNPTRCYFGTPTIALYNLANGTKVLTTQSIEKGDYHKIGNIYHRVNPKLMTMPVT